MIKIPMDMIRKLLRKDIISKLIAAISILLLYLACAKDLQGLIYSHLYLPIDYIHNLIDGNVALNIWLSLLVFICMIKLCHDTYHDAYFSVYRLLVFVLLTIIPFYQSPWQFAKAFYLVGFDYVVALFSLAIVGVELQKIWKRPKPEQNISRKETSFTPDEPLSKAEASEAIQRFTENLSKQLLNTDISKESFAFCITGNWGAGKTTFLHALKEELKDKTFIIEFNPWNSNSPKQIVTDFFSTLKRELSKYYTSLDRRVMDYTKAMIDTYSANVWLSWLTVFTGSKSLQSRKDNLSNVIKQLPKRVIVLIDDIDRLDSEEVFEVLRLIRNTAQFSNMMYIAAFDKEYVMKLIGERNINGEEYIAKIFPLEIALPKSDSYELWNCLAKEVRMMYRPTGKVNAMFDKMSKTEKQIIISHCSTYRKCKRFARQFVAIADYMKQSIEKGNYILRDVFYIELLHAYYPDIYKTIAYQPEATLRKARSSKNGQFIWYYESDENPILKILFGDLNGDKVSSSGIASYESYHNYFTLIVPKHVISVEEYQGMLRAKSIGNEMKSYFTMWFCSTKYKKDGSTLYNHFCTSLLNTNSPEEDFMRYFCALIYWIQYDSENIEKQISIFKKILRIKLYTTEEKRSRLADFYRNRIITLSKSDKENSKKVAKLLSSIFIVEERKQTYIFSDGDVKQLLIDNIQVVLHRKQWDAICVILDDKNDLNQTLRASVITSGSQTLTVVMETVISYFKEKSPKSKYSETLSPYCNAMNRNIIRIGMSAETQIYESQINAVFGNTQQGRDFFNEFAAFCFK